MRTQLNANTVAHLHKTHTIRLRFDDTPEDQALYAALSTSSDHECRTPLPRQIKYLLGMAMGLVRPDQLLLDRMRSAIECTANTKPADVPSPARPVTTLRLIPGGAKTVKPEDNDPE